MELYESAQSTGQEYAKGLTIFDRFNQKQSRSMNSVIQNVLQKIKLKDLSRVSDGVVKNIQRGEQGPNTEKMTSEQTFVMNCTDKKSVILPIMQKI